MKLKTYTFTEEEVMTLRKAVIEYHYMIKKLKPHSPIAIRNAKALREKFINDAMTI
jgi:hypothetical protein